MNQPSSAEGPDRKDKVDSQQDTVIGGSADASSLNVTKVVATILTTHSPATTHLRPIQTTGLVRIGEYLVTDTLGRGGMGLFIEHAI